MMWEHGWVDEVRSLLEVGLAEGRTASRAIGYAQIRQHLDGELSAAEAKEETIVRTRQFARRQDTWFRRDPRIHWIDGSAADAERNRARALDILAGPTDRMVT
jgi:tRNA dimethylallyltransferase